MGECVVSHLVHRNNEASEIARDVSNTKGNLSKDYYDANVNNRLYKPADVVYIRIGHHKAGTCNQLAAPRMDPSVAQVVNVVRVTALMPSNRVTQVHHYRISGRVEGPAQSRAQTKEGGRQPPRRSPQFQYVRQIMMI